MRFILQPQSQAFAAILGIVIPNIVVNINTIIDYIKNYFPKKYDINFDIKLPQLQKNQSIPTTRGSAQGSRGIGLCFSGV